MILSVETVIFAVSPMFQVCIQMVLIGLIVRLGISTETVAAVAIPVISLKITIHTRISYTNSPKSITIGTLNPVLS